MSLYLEAPPCADADELIRTLENRRGRHPEGTSEDFRLPEMNPTATWIFRGQAKAAWHLEPSARRNLSVRHGGNEYTAPAVVAFDYRVATNLGPLTPQETADAEQAAVLQFASIADSVGLEIPDDSHDLRDYTRDHQPNVVEEFPRPALRATYGLAQHSGVPTRFLDWSRSYLTAAYFAAVDAARDVVEGRRGDTESLAVFALAESLLLTRGVASWDPGPVLVTAPYASNPNLRAQRGCFTLVRFKKPTSPTNGQQAARPALTQHIPNLDDLLSQKTDADLERGFGFQAPMLIKFTLPIRHAPNLLDLLATRGVHGGSLFPGFEGAARGQRERAWHNKTEPALTVPRPP